MVGGLGMAMFCVGLIAGKMIGVEMMAVIQVSFVSLISLEEMNPCFQALSSLFFVNGYNSISDESYLEDSRTPIEPKGIFLYSRFL